MPRSRLYPPSVRPGIPKLGPCPPGWRTVKLRDLFDVMSRPAELVPDQRYQLVTVKRSRGGVVAREELRGDEIKTPTQFYVKEGDFVISRRQIIHGACGFVPAELDGAVVSNEYDVLRPRPELVPGFLRELVHTEYMQRTFFQSSVGVDVEKMIFDLGFWLSYEIHAPPTREQRALAEILNDSGQAIGRAEFAVAQARRARLASVQWLMARGQPRGPGQLASAEHDGDPLPMVPLASVAQVRSGLAKNASREVTNPVEVPYLRVANVQDGYFNLDEVKAIVLGADEIDTYKLQAGDVLMAEGGDADKLGRGDVWRGQISPCVHQNHVFSVRCGPRILPDYLSMVNGSPHGKAYFRLCSKQTTNLASINTNPAVKWLTAHRLADT